MPGKASRKSSGRSSKKKSSSGGIDVSNESKKEPEVGYVRDNVIYIKDEKGYNTLTINKNTTDEQISKWGSKYGVDMKKYLK